MDSIKAEDNNEIDKKVIQKICESRQPQIRLFAHMPRQPLGRGTIFNFFLFE
jgi:hypothetical protein